MPITYLPLAALVLGLLGSPGLLAQERVYRCPNNEYINNDQLANERGCKPIEGGSVTIFQAPRSAAASTAAGRPATGAQPLQRAMASNEQRARDADKRAILEAELKKLESRLAEQLKEYNSGEPDKQASEARNHQKYLDRVAEMKSSLARTESDILSLRGELNRLAR